MTKYFTIFMDFHSIKELPLSGNAMLIWFWIRTIPYGMQSSQFASTQNYSLDDKKRTSNQIVEVLSQNFKVLSIIKSRKES